LIPEIKVHWSKIKLQINTVIDAGSAGFCGHPSAKNAVLERVANFAKSIQRAAFGNSHKNIPWGNDRI